MPLFTKISLSCPLAKENIHLYTKNCVPNDSIENALNIWNFN